MKMHSVFKTFIFITIVTTGALFAQNTSVKSDALFHAVKANNLKQVKQIVKSGVSINVLNNDNKTALDIATERHYKKTARFLVKQGGRVTSDINVETLRSFFRDRAFGFLIGGFLLSPFMWIGTFTSMSDQSLVKQL